MNQILKIAISALLLVMLPTALADTQIIQGPSALAASPGAVAAGGKYIITDPTGNNQDGLYFALMGVNALAFVPNGVVGSAYANFKNEHDTFAKSIDLRPGDNHGDTVRFDMGYTGSVSANVEKTRLGGNALAFANIGGAVVDFAAPPVAQDCFDLAGGATGMASILALPNYAVGNAGASGSAQFNVAKVGDTVMGPSGLASDEVLRVYGNTLGDVIIAGPGQLVNGAPAAQNNVLGIAGLGTATLATDNAFPVPGEGAALSASGMGSLTAARSWLTPVLIPAVGFEHPDSRITNSVTGSADGGAWDGATPIGTSEIKTISENVRTEASGSTNTRADTYLPGDFAASLSVLGDLAFHSNSPIYVPQQVKELLAFDPTNQEGLKLCIPEELLNDERFDTVKMALEGRLDGEDAQLGDGERQINPEETLGRLAEDTQAMETLRVAGQCAGCACDDLSCLDKYKPDVQFFNGENTEELVEVEDPIVAADIALTAATVTRTAMGSLTSPILTAEAYISDADTNAVARQSDRSVIASQDDLNIASGAHLRSHPDTVGSVAFDIQAAGQAWPPVGTPTAYGDLSIYGTITAGPTADGDRWDDAGSLMNFDSGLMQSNMGTKYYRTTNGPLDTMNWIQGADLNPGMYGQNYMSKFEDSVSGAPQITAKIDPLVYFENAQGRNSIWLSGTVHGGL